MWPYWTIPVAWLVGTGMGLIVSWLWARSGLWPYDAGSRRRDAAAWQAANDREARGQAFMRSLSMEDRIPTSSSVAQPGPGARVRRATFNGRRTGGEQ